MCGSYEGKRELADDTTEIAGPFTPIESAEPQQQTAPFLGIAQFFRRIIDRITAGDFQGAVQAANDGVDAILTPYYVGKGDIDHVRFLDDLERAKGSELTRAELELFGRVTGRWCAQKYLTELEVLPEPERTAALIEVALGSELRRRGLDATVEVTAVPVTDISAEEFVNQA